MSRNFEIDFEKNGEAEVAEKTVVKWFKDGPDFEDEPPDGSKPYRAANHFHNPIKGWQNGVIQSWIQAQMTDGNVSGVGCLVSALTQVRHAKRTRDY